MKRIISFVLCLSMLLSTLPVNAFAAEVDETTAEASQVQETEAPAEAPAAETHAAESATEVSEATEKVPDEEAEFAQAETEEPVPAETYTAAGITWVPDPEFPDNEELFAVYAEQQLYGTSISTFGTAAGETLDAGNKLIYDALAKRIREIAAGTRDSSVIAVGQYLGNITVTTGDGEKITLPCTPEEEIDVSSVNLNLNNLLSVLLGDFPYELYWFDKTLGVSVWPVSSGSGKICYVFYFTVSPDYSVTGHEGTYDLDTGVTGAASAAAANARTIADKYAASSDYEKLVAYRDEICSLTDYNYNAASSSYSGGYGDPWQLIWVFDKDDSTKIVCEGYSKAFQYLCDLSDFDNDITCYNVVGTLNGGAHMWNIVRVNGSSYLVDVTNCDSGFDLFLRGGSPNSSGVYTFAGQKFAYASETTALWGTGESSILTLATEDLTASNFPTEPDTDDDSDAAGSDVMTGEELVAALNACTTVNYELTRPVVISSAIELPNIAENYPGIVNVCGSGSITVKEGGSLTFANCLDFANGGTLTVEKGGSLTVNGWLTVGVGGSATIDGDYTLGEGASVVLNYPGTISGIGPSDINFYGIVWDEASLTEALAVQGYASHEVDIPGYDMDGDGNPDPVVLTQDTAIPEGCTLLIGNELCTAAVLQIADGVTLTNNGTLATWMGASLILGENALLAGNGAIYNDGTITSCGTIEGTVEGNGTLTEYMTQAQFLTLLQTSDEVTVSKPLTLSSSLTIPAGKSVTFENPGDLVVSGGAVLTVEGNLEFHSPSLTVQSGGSLILRGNGYLFCGSALTIEEGASYAIEDEAEIYASAGTALTGITKGEVVNSNTLMDPYDDLQAFAEIYGADYKKFYLSIATDYTVSTDMTLSGNIALDHFGNTITITDGATLTINGDWTVGMDATAYGGPKVPGYIVVEDGELVINGTLDLLYGSTLSVAGGSGTVTINGIVCCEQGSTVDNCGWIYAQNGGIVDVTDGSYSSQGGQIYQKYSYDSDGNITCGKVLGVDPQNLTVTIEADSKEAIIREAILALGDTAGELRALQIQFIGDTTLSADLTIPEIASTIIRADSTLTVPAGITLTDESGMYVYGTLIAEGRVIATNWPIVFSGVDSLVHPENVTNYFVEGLTVESFSIASFPERPTIDSHVSFSVTYYPIGAMNIGEIHYEVISGIGTLDENNILTSPVPGPVTVRATMIDYDENGEVVYTDIFDEITVVFSDSYQVFTSISEIDFFEDGWFGLYAGSSTQLCAEVYGGEQYEEYIECDTLQLTLEGGDGFATLTEEDGIYTLRISEDLNTHEVLTIHAFTSDNSARPQTVSLYARPRASTVDVALNGTAVTGQTVLFDLNRDGASVQLSPAANPTDACIPDGLEDDLETPLVQWTSSNTKVAAVDNSGNVTFTGTTGTVKITMTANFGSKKTAAVTFQVVALAQAITPNAANTDTLIGGSSATYTVTDDAGSVLKSSAVKWFLCDKSGAPIASHPYASITAAGKLTTRAVADETKVYLMAQVVGDENSACLAEPLLVTLYPAVSSVQILDADLNSINGKTLLHDIGTLGLEHSLSWTAWPYLESVKSVSWKSSAPKVAEIGEKTGLITVLKPGTAKFTLTVTALNGKKATASFTMKFGTFTQNLLLSATLPDGTVTDDMHDLMICSGQSITFHAENDPEDVTTTGVTWSLDSNTYASITSKGVLKAKTVNNPVPVTVKAASKDGACSNDTTTVIILPKQDAVILWNENDTFITKTTQTLEIGDSLQLYASEDVTWTSSKPGVAEVDKETGCLKALANGTATITAATTDGSSRKATFTLKVTKLSRNVTITTKTGVPFSVASGKTLDLVGTVKYPDGSTDTKVTWSVNDTTLATISSSGKLTAAKNLIRTAMVRVYATAKDGSSRNFVDVQVVPLTTAIEIFGSFGSSVYSEDVTNTTQKWDLTTREKMFTLSTKTFPEGAMDVTWKSSNSKVAAVNEKTGEVLCLKSGTVTITATAGDGSGRKATFKLTIHKTMDEGSLKLPETAFIAGGKTLTLTKLEGYAIDALATNKTLTWTLTYPNGAAVPTTAATVSNGTLKTKSVTAPVDLCVTAAATDGSGETARCTVTVYPATKGIALYTIDTDTGTMSTVTGKTVSVPVNQGCTILPDTTNVKDFGYTDDKTADEYLPNGTAWTVTLSRKIARVEFDGQAMTVYADGTAAGQSVKVTLKANDGSGKSASVTVKFTEAVPE